MYHFFRVHLIYGQKVLGPSQMINHPLGRFFGDLCVPGTMDNPFIMPLEPGKFDQPSKYPFPLIH